MLGGNNNSIETQDAQLPFGFPHLPKEVVIFPSLPSMLRFGRRVVGSLVAASVAPSTRSIYTMWGSTPQEPQVFQNKTHLYRLSDKENLHCFDFLNFPAVEDPALGPMKKSERYLLSAIDEDTKRILSVDWTYEFCPFWRDRVESHEELFDVLYNPGRLLRKFLIGSCVNDASSHRPLVETRLNYLRSALHWAEETEKRYTAIWEVRFKMQREVFEPFEREKILAGCVEIYEDFGKQVPHEFKRKAMQDLGYHVGNMRHWIWSTPNIKHTTYKRLN